jgi:hypothetical protein
MTTAIPAEVLARNAMLDQAHEAAARQALLEHARMGRAVASATNGKIVEVSPAEIFARYGFDEFGRPLPGTPAE